MAIIGMVYSAQQPDSTQQAGDNPQAPPSTSSTNNGFSGASIDDQNMTALTAVFDSASDGDTIRTDAGKVRLIGIDTPERGECGYAEAADLIYQHVSPGETITLLLPKGQNKTDRYGRLIRYAVTTDGTDLSLLQLNAGNAVARYDSIDGYPAHPHEQDYRAAQRATMDSNRAVHTVACTAH